jgi:hypothetical protein
MATTSRKNSVVLSEQFYAECLDISDTEQSLLHSTNHENSVEDSALHDTLAMITTMKRYQ